MEKAITDCCNHSAVKREKPRKYVANPYEIGISIPRGPERERILANVVLHAFAGQRVALVTRGVSSLGVDESIALGTQCINNGRQRVLVYPTVADEFLDVGPLIDADFAVIGDERAEQVPALVYMDGPNPPGHAHALGYLGKPSLCPVLPSSSVYFSVDDHAGIADFVRGYLAKQAAAVPLYGLVLTGGQSTRMNEDKSSIDYHGKPQVARCAELLETVCSQVFVSCRAEQSHEPHLAPYTQIHDAFLGFGPMGGILSAQKEYANVAWLVLACDLPFVDGDTLSHLIRHRNPFKLATAYLGSESQLPEPLCAIYEPKSVHRMLGFLGKGFHCPRKVLINSDSNLLALPEPHALDNANSPDERAAALQALREGATE